MKISGIYKKIKEQLRIQLAIGTAPEQLSMSLTLGILFGVLPFPFVTTALLAGLAIAFKLNMIITQITNYAVYPIQALLYLPFLKMGKMLGSLNEVSIKDVYQLIQTNVYEGILQVWQIHLWAILVWTIFGLPSGIVLYYVFRNTLRAWQLRRNEKAIN